MTFASHTYMKYVYVPEEDVGDDVVKIMHTIKCQVTGEVVWYDTPHSPYSYLTREQFIKFVDERLTVTTGAGFLEKDDRPHTD